MEGKANRLGSIIQRAKSHSFVVGVLLIASVLGALVTTTDSVKKLSGIVGSAFSPSMNQFSGIWVIQETELTPKTYILLEVIGKKIYGKTKIKYPAYSIINHMAQINSGIYDTEIDGKTIKFKTKRQFTRIAGDPTSGQQVIVAEYEGDLNDNNIRFVMNVQGGYNEIVNATKLPTREGEKQIQEDFSDWE
ncbi:MAG: hypothetical protein JAZ12_12605 [Candidatus Thiodiazotropha taylori]|nr:hypothetical protein [Candidatus Thiodiazotropha taylori]